MELERKLAKRLDELAERGNDYVDNEQYREALDAFALALTLIPHPIEDWEASTWFLIAIGETQFFAGAYSESIASMARAKKCPGGLDNSLLYLRMGQAQFESGDKKGAEESLMRAYMSGGREMFSDEDSKYWEIIEPHVIGD